MSITTEQPVRSEFISCPACHTKNSEVRLRVPDRFDAETGEPFTLVKCKKCTLLYLNPRPPEQESAAFYENEAYNPFISAKAELTAFDKLYQRIRTYNNRRKRKLIERWHNGKGRLLDVGCGTGEFLAEMAAAGWQVRGVERDSKAAAYAVDKLRVNVVRGTVEMMPSVPESFDVVTMWHVLEHVYHPHKTLMQIRDLLKSGGLLVIAVPNAESLDAKIYKQNWVAYDAPRHLQHFNIRALRALCEMHGFAVAHKTLLPVDSFFNALMSEKLAEKRSNTRWLNRLRFLRAGVVANSAVLLGKLSNLFSKPIGSTLLVVLRK